MPQALELDDKFTFVLNDLSISILRYHEAWMDFTVSTPGYAAIRALVLHALEMEAKLPPRPTISRHNRAMLQKLADEFGAPPGKVLAIYRATSSLDATRNVVRELWDTEDPAPGEA